MSGIAALKGYRTQFLYSLHHILSEQNSSHRYFLEGKEDLDVIGPNGEVEFYIQVKNTTNPISLSDLLTEKGTSFIKRYLEIRTSGAPVLVSFGPVSSELISWSTNAAIVSKKEKVSLQKYKITESDWLKVKRNVVFKLVNEEIVLAEIIALLKTFTQIDPVPTLENLMYWLSYSAEKQQPFTYRDVFQKIEQIGTYLSERIAITNRYGIYIKPLHQITLDEVSFEHLKKEYYYGTNARYEHILTGQDIVRERLLNEIGDRFQKDKVVVIHGASGQGKTSLAYRYAHDYAPAALIYEIIAQEDITATNEAITALNAIVKKLNMPVLVIVNVYPNTVYWLKIIQASRIFNHLSFLVTIRNEDWFRAKSSELNFSYAELEVELQEHEAALMYQELLKKANRVKYSDFKEAWLDLGQHSPLLEFTYAITQGESLFHRLQQQVLLLNTEEESGKAIGQIALLRTICLADLGGARVDITKLKGSPSIQFTLQKFEREYLLKHTEDRKYITGLHPIRSKLLCELIFDDYLSTQKNEIIKCLAVIEEGDVYPFLLKCLYENFATPAELIDILKSKQQLTWVEYQAAVKSLLWAGARDFVDTNSPVFAEAQKLGGDMVIAFFDIFHGVALDLSALWEVIDDEKRTQIISLQKEVTAKNTVFKYLTSLLATVSTPNQHPVYSKDWSAVGEVMFWLAQFPDAHSEIINLSDNIIGEAFDKLELDVLSKLMLALHYFSPEFNELRLKFAPKFVTRLRAKYQIPDLVINDEVTVNYILDVTIETEDFSVHDYVLEIIEMLRDAFPDKNKFNTQAHGHRNLMIELPFDDSKKTISAENLPLEEWTNVNGMICKLNEYAYRPADWSDFLAALQSWEQEIKAMLREFLTAFAMLKKKNGEKLVKVMEQSVHDFGFELKSPKSIADPFCLPVKTAKIKSKSVDLFRGAIKENMLSTRHRQFFKNYRDFKSNIENFLKQSGKVVYERLKNMQEPLFPVDSHLLHLSYVNLYNGIKSREPFVAEKQKSFKDLLKANNEITEAELFDIATVWKDFHTLFPKNDFKDISLKEKITGIKHDFENAIAKAIKKLNKENGYGITYINNHLTGFEPIFKVEAPSSLEVLLTVSELYGLLRTLMNQPEYTSLKQLMIIRHFANIFIIPVVNGRTFNHNYYKFPEYIFRDFAFMELKLHHLVTYPMPENLINKLNIDSWIAVYTPMNDIYRLQADYINMRLLVEHLADLQYFDELDNLDEYGRELTIKHIEKVMLKLQPLFQSVINQLAEIITLFEYNYLDDESEAIYIKDMRDIRDNLFPTSKGDEVEYEAKLTMNIIVEWAKQLRNTTNKWGRFILILQNKALQHYREQCMIEE